MNRRIYKNIHVWKSTGKVTKRVFIDTETALRQMSTLRNCNDNGKGIVSVDDLTTFLYIGEFQIIFFQRWMT